MRNGQNKRMRGRNRGHKSHHGGGGGGGGGHHHNPLTRVYESNGPDVKIRGTAHHIAEKYLQLARDAQGSGDPVTAENHFQHAEHYLRMIAAAQEQFRAQNPYYQAPPAPGEIRDEAFDGEDNDEGGQPGQGQPAQGQPTQGQPPQGQANFGGQQNFNNPQNYNNSNNQQQPYPPREQPQPYGGHQPNSNYQGRPQHQQQQQPNQPYNPPPQYSQPSNAPAGDAGQLPSFITGAQPQQGAPGGEQNGYDNNQGGDRYPRHRRRRHRGPGGPRPDMQNMPQDFRGDDGPEPGNS
jgi:hypothetical protein